jgi:hypothetical protein
MLIGYPRDSLLNWPRQLVELPRGFGRQNESRHIAILEGIDADVNYHVAH